MQPARLLQPLFGRLFFRETLRPSSDGPHLPRCQVELGHALFKQYTPKGGPSKAAFRFESKTLWREVPPKSATARSPTWTWNTFWFGIRKTDSFRGVSMFGGILIRKQEGGQ